MRQFQLKANSALSRALALFYDTAAAAIAITWAMWLAFGEAYISVLDRKPMFLLLVAAVYAGFALCAYLVFSQHRATWRYTSIQDIVTLLRSATVTFFLFIPFVFLVTRAEDIPRSSVVMAWFLHLGIMAAPRLVARLIFRAQVQNYATANAFRHRLPIIVVGAGPEAQRFVRALRQDPNPVYDIFGVVAADEILPKAWSVVDDLKQTTLLGTASQFPQIVKQTLNDGVRIRHLVLCDGARTPHSIQRILPISSEHAMTLLRCASDDDVSEGANAASGVSPLALQDVLPRVARHTAPGAGVDQLKGRRILITGAGGSIGSELARHIARAQPAVLALVEKSEFNLFAIDEELAGSHPDVQRAAVLGDIRDASAVDKWMSQYQPDIVFHAAALKHVPMVEARPLEGILTNVEGTRNLADACIKHKVRAMVMISTDKAVNPKGVMGATKRLAEAYCQSLDVRGERDVEQTRFPIVRFGNVLWSTGSVVSRFRRQLSEGLPLTVTHPEIVRFFMTIDDAVAMVLLASGRALQNLEKRGTIYVLNMGEPIKILDLARTMTMLAGKRPEVDVPIQYIGLRPGEKLVEELIHPQETLTQSGIEGVLTAQPRSADLGFLKRDIDALVNFARDGKLDEALRALQNCVPDYQPAAQSVAALRAIKKV